MPHSFHIPVLGLGFSIDTPLKVARYGISSTVSIVDDELTERMRKYHCDLNGIKYDPIHKSVPDSRAKRITAYLNLLNMLVNRQFELLRKLPFIPGSDIERYFSLLPEQTVLRQGYDLLEEYEDGVRKNLLQNLLRNQMTRGTIDVNIMAKVDKLNYNKKGDPAGELNSDALAALRGFAESDLESSVVISAGMNPKLFNYIAAFQDFYPDEKGNMRKKVILKVSNYRSASIQAKMLAKKGIWVSEYRIESGLNCGGHAFATEGLLMGPILEEFKAERASLQLELFGIYQAALIQHGIRTDIVPPIRVSAQGGIGTALENNLLLKYYQLDGTGWGSPFLLVPDATNVDDRTLEDLTHSTHSDYYLSNVSPLGVLFNNFRKSSIEKLRLDRIAKGRPGSPCTKKYLCSNTEFTDQPICTASRQYQHLKIEQLKSANLSEEEYQTKYDAVTEKTCLCEGLCASVYVKNKMIRPRENATVSICPGPNLAYFSSTYSLDDMVGHIYGKKDLLQYVDRPNIFISELNLYIDYLRQELTIYRNQMNDKKARYFQAFKEQLEKGIAYYKQTFPAMMDFAEGYLAKLLFDLSISEQMLGSINVLQTLIQIKSNAKDRHFIS